MNEQTDAVPQRMPKEFSVPGFGNFFPGNRIDFPAGHPGFDPIQRRLLRRPDNFIDLSLFFTCMTDRHRAGHIAAIIVKSRAEIHSYKIPFPDFPVGRFGMRTGRIFSGSGNDGKRHAPRTIFPHFKFQKKSNLFFGKPVVLFRSDIIADRKKSLIGNLLRAADNGEFLRRFYPSR